MNDVATDLRHDGASPAPAPDDVYAGLDDCRASRDRAVASASAALDDAVGLVADALERGAVLNLSECARRAGVAKQTLYSRLPADVIGGRR